MAETLGTLCDKLTTVKLKQYHTEDSDRLASLATQEKQLVEEIETFLADAVAGRIPEEKLTFAANKVYKKAGNEVAELKGSIGELFSKMAEVNCRLWHVQETVYDFEAVPADEKDDVIRQLAVVNLERNNCIDELDRTFRDLVSSIKR